MQKKIFDAAMIFFMGISPLGFEYLKQNVEATTIISKIESDLEVQNQAQNM
jgi:hypothetical protein